MIVFVFLLYSTKKKERDRCQCLKVVTGNVLFGQKIYAIKLITVMVKADNWSFAGTYEIIAVRNTEKAFKINSG